MTSSRAKDQPVYLVVAAVLISGAFLMFYFALNGATMPQVQGAETSQPASVTQVKKTVGAPAYLSPQQMQEDTSGQY